MPSDEGPLTSGSVRVTVEQVAADQLRPGDVVWTDKGWFTIPSPPPKFGTGQPPLLRLTTPNPPTED